MRFKNTFIFALLLVLVSLYFFFIDIPKQKKVKEEKEKTEKVVVFEAEDVEELTLIYPQSEIGVRKQGEQWELAKPKCCIGAEKGAVDGIISRLRAATITRIVDETPSELTTYGLDKPAIKILLKLKSKTENEEILIGEKTQVGHSVYLKKKDHPRVYLAGSYLRDDLIKTVFDFRNKDVIKFDREEIAEVHVDSISNGSFVIQSKGEEWFFVSPVQLKADRVELIRAIATLEDAKVLEFVNDDPVSLDEYGLTQPKLHVSLILKKDLGKREILLGNDYKNGIYAKVSDKKNVFMINLSPLTTFNKNMGQFYNKNLFDFDTEKVEKIKLTREGKVIIELDKEKTEPGKMENILGSLKGLRANEFISANLNVPAEYQLFPPIQEVEVIEKTSNSHRLSIGKEDRLKGGNYVYKAKEKIVFFADESAIKDILKKLTEN